MDNSKLESCFRLYAEQAWRLATYMLSDRHEAFDTVQQAFLVASKKSKNIPATNPWPWLRAVVINEARNARRKRKPTPVVTLEDSAIDAQSDPYKFVAKEESIDELRTALDELPDSELEAVVMTSLQGLTHQKAADALGIPVKTLSSRVSRGLNRLKVRLSGLQESLLTSFAAMPLLPPPGGFKSAVVTWKAGAGLTAGKTGSTTSTVLGGSLVSKNTVTAFIVVLATLIGFGGGVLLSSELSSNNSEETVSPSTSRETTTDGTNLNKTNSENGNLDTSSASEPTASEKTPPNDSTELSEALAKAREELKATKTERAAYVDTIQALENELAPYRKAKEEKGPVFTFGKHGHLEGITDADWKVHAAATRAMIVNLTKLREARIDGKQPSREVLIAVQKNSEKMRVFEYGVLDKFLTWAKHNGEYTHPISHSNLIASELKAFGLPLSKTQIAAIEKLGLEYEQKFDDAQKEHTLQTPRVRKIQEEYLLKGQFVDAVWELLTIEQLDFLVDEKWHHVAHFDLYCPSLMIIHSSPVITGDDIEEIVEKLKKTLTDTFDLSAENTDVLQPLLNTWQSDVESILEPVKPSMAGFYTFEQSIVAIHATVGLFESMRDFVPLSEESRAKLLDSYLLFIPRVVTKE